MAPIITRTKAKELGLKRYCTGKPCGRGHICERLVSTFQCLECVKPQIRRYQKANPQIKRVLNQKHREKRALAKKRWNRANRRHVADYAARRRRENPQVLIADRLRTRLWKALHGQESGGSAVKLLGTPLEQAIIAIETQFLPGMNWANHGDWHLDHRRALATFDLTDPDQLAIACHISNLQPLWATDNLSKGAR